MNPKQKRYLTIILIANLCLITWLVIRQMNRPTLNDLIEEWEDNHYISDDSIRQWINYASVIVITKNEIHGNKFTPTITEILKHDEGVLFDYKVGDTLRDNDQEALTNQPVPDGSIIFLTGSPASQHHSWSYYNKRIVIAERLTLGDFRKLVQED